VTVARAGLSLNRDQELPDLAILRTNSVDLHGLIEHQATLALRTNQTCIEAIVRHCAELPNTMAFFLRECTIGIVHIDDEIILGARGIAEWLDQPTLVSQMTSFNDFVNAQSVSRIQRLSPRYGLRRSAPQVPEEQPENAEPLEQNLDERPLQQYLVGAALDEALASDADDLDVHWPFRALSSAGPSDGSLEELKRRRKAGIATEVDWRGREAIL